MNRYTRIHAIVVGFVTFVLISLAVFHRIFVATKGSGISAICGAESLILVFLLCSTPVSMVLLVMSTFKKNIKQVVVYLLTVITPFLALIITISVDPLLLYVT